jgi:hypothetical protein
MLLILSSINLTIIFNKSSIALKGWFPAPLGPIIEKFHLWNIEMYCQLSLTTLLP